MDVKSMKEYRAGFRMTPVQVRLKPAMRDKAKALAQRLSKEKRQKITEADIYRTAIDLFLSQNSTDSRDHHPVST